MRAVIVAGAGKQRRLEVVSELAAPVAAPGQVLVRVRAAGLNRADLLMNARHRSETGASGPPVAGNEFAGEVAGLGEGVTTPSMGARVMGFGASAFAEFMVVDARHVLRVPEGMDWQTAASYPTALLTMHDAIVTNGRLVPGEAVLIQGAGSGVGILGLQIAKAKGAGLVIAASRSDERLAALAGHGADQGVNISAADWPEKIHALTDGKGVDLIVDMVSGATVGASMRAAAICGRIVNVGRLGGMTGDFDFDLHALRRIDYIGVTFRTRSDEEIADIVARAEADLGQLVAAGRIGVPIHARFPLERTADAYAAMRKDAHIGKIVITL